MGNVISTRINDFLRNYPPFSLMADHELTQISRKTVVKYYQKKETLFSQGSPPDQFIYIVRDGAVKLERNDDGTLTLVDECDEGDILGLRAIMAGDKYRLSAIANEESLVYAIDIDSLRPCIEKNPAVASYLAKSFAGNHKLYKKEGLPALYSDIDNPVTELGVENFQYVSHTRHPVTCLANTTIREAALIMRDHNVGSIIIVNEKDHPIGIITDRDLRNKVIAGDYRMTDSVIKLMSKPVITIKEGLKLADIQIIMMEHNIHHLCVTDNGTSNSRVIGIISEHDLLVTQGQNPAVLLKEIYRSKNEEDLVKVRDRVEEMLKEYLKIEVAVGFIAAMITRINDALAVKAITLSIEKVKGENVDLIVPDWCWLSLGSGGRKEQLLRTDQDNAILYDDAGIENAQEIKDYFLSVARKASEIIRVCGFEYCPANMMASNPLWCMGLSEWKKQFSKWIDNPTEKNVMYSTIFFDFRPVYGDTILAGALSQHIVETVDADSMFAVNLGKNALLNPPPLTFFRNFMVEKSGEHKDAFDLKARAMMPLVDAARLLALTSGIQQVTNTIERYQKMAALEAGNAALYLQSAEAYEVLLRFKAEQGLKHGNDGRYIDPGSLSKMERLNLKNCFKPISEIQELLQVRFRLSQFM